VYENTSTLGRGFSEFVYQDALEAELRRNNIPYDREKKITVQYEGETLKRTFRVDFLVFNSIIIEIKALPFLNVRGFRQTLNYLKTSGIQLGILVNFGGDRLTYKRIVNIY